MAITFGVLALAVRARGARTRTPIAARRPRRRSRPGVVGRRPPSPGARHRPARTPSRPRWHTPAVNDALELTVSEQDAGRRLDVFLAGPLGSRSQAQQLIDAGHVLVDGQPRPKRHAVMRRRARGRGGRARRRRGRPRPRPVLGGLRGRAPAGRRQAGRRGRAPGARPSDRDAGPGAWRPRAEGGEPRGPGSCTAWTATPPGLLVVAKDDAVHRALKAAAGRRTLRREYLALVDGHPEARTGTIDAPIGRDRRDRVLMSIDTDAPARGPDPLRDRAAARGDVTLLRVVLDTGRTHQIRVHMAAIGHPVCGDRQYGTAGELRARAPVPARRPADLRAPGDRRVEVDVRSPLPEDLVRALASGRAGGTLRKRPAGRPVQAAPPSLRANRPPEVGEGVRFAVRAAVGGRETATR